MIRNSLINVMWSLKGSILALFKTPRFQIRKGYNHRESVVHFDDSKNKDEWQNEVYQMAKEALDKHGFEDVIDFGCGSGFKLLKYFKNSNTLGFEIEPTLSYLRDKYVDSKWASFDAEKKYSCDILILSDVIEHLENPSDVLQSLIESIDFKMIFISTPDRSLLEDGRPYGPPKNVSHYREWNFNEFKAYLSDYIEIENHLVTNREQATQLIIGNKVRGKSGM